MAVETDLQNDESLPAVDRGLDPDAVSQGLITVLPEPTGGEEVVVELAPGQIINLQALPLAEAVLIKDGDDLRLDFGADGSILLKDFFDVAESDVPPTLIIQHAIEIPIEAVIAAVDGEGRLEPSAGEGREAATIPGTGANFNPAALLDPSETELSALVPETELPTDSAFGIERLLGLTALSDSLPEGDFFDFLSGDFGDAFSGDGSLFSRLFGSSDGPGSDDGSGIGGGFPDVGPTGGSGTGGTPGGGGGFGGAGGGTPQPAADIDLTAADRTGTEDGPAIPLAITAAITDPGETVQSVSVTFTNLPANTTVNAGTLNPANGVWTGSLAELNALTIDAPADYSGSIGAAATVTTDQGSKTDNFNIVVTPTGDIDLVANPVPAAVEGDNNIPVGLHATIDDVDNSETEDTVTIEFVGLPAGTTVNGGTLSDTNADGTPDSWTGSLAEFNALTLTPPTNFSGTIDATAEISSNESQTPETQATTLTVTPVNDPPVHTLPPDQTVPEDDPLTFSAANNNAITVADVDAGTGQIVTTVSVDTGTLAATADGAATVAGNNSGTLTITGTLTDVNDTLDGLTYRGPIDQGANATLTITTNDQGNAGAGGALTDTDTLGITVVPDADQPSISFQVLDAGGNPNTQIIPNETVILRTTARFDIDTAGDFSDQSEVHTVTVTLPAGFTYEGDTTVTARVRAIDRPDTADGSVTLTLWTGQTGITQNGIFDYEITLTAPNSIPTDTTVTFSAEAVARETANNDTANAQQSVTVDMTTPPDIPAPRDDAVTVASDSTVSGNLFVDNGSGADDFGDDGAPTTGTSITRIEDEGGNVFTLANPNGATVNGDILEDIPTIDGGLLTVNFDNGDFTYTPPTARTPPQPLGDGFERFNYTIQDDDGDTGNADLAIQIQGAVIIDPLPQQPALLGTTAGDVIIGDSDPTEPIQQPDSILAISVFNPAVDGDDIIFGDIPANLDLTQSNSAIIADLNNNPPEFFNDPVNGSFDTIFAGPGDDTIYSGGGGGMITGGPGSDLMFAGDGAEQFVWRSPNFTGGSDADGSTDEIRGFDFTDADSLNLSQILDFNAGTDDIDDFVQLSFGGGDATFSIDADGSGGPFDNLDIVLKGVDQATAEAGLGLPSSTTGDIVQAMVNQGHIIAA